MIIGMPGKQCVTRKKKRRDGHMPSSSRRRAIKAAVWIRDRGICQLCGLPVDPTAPLQSSEHRSLDHIVDFKDGGRYVIGNLRLAHRLCNQEAAR